MKELSEILTAVAKSSGPFALATVVQTEGSSYRRPGARMLILPNGITVGSISGGCLEKNVILRAQTVLETGESILIGYDTTSEEDIAFGAGLGCKGVVHILIEQIETGKTLDTPNLIAFVTKIFADRDAGVVATVIRSTNAEMAKVGARLTLDRNRNVASNIQDDNCRCRLLADAEKLLASGKSEAVSYDLATGRVDAFVEIIHAPAQLVIFGGGYDAIPLVRLAKEIGFHITVLDRRAVYANTERFPQADAVILMRTEELPESLQFDERTSAVVMAHNYLTDKSFLKALLPIRLRYLGLMGPRKRAEKMLQELQDENLFPVTVGKLHNPVGLDIGADNPEQIALSILAEIQAAATGHAGGLLCEKRGPIHAPNVREPAIIEPAVLTSNGEDALCAASL